jgi:deazaflavin-dependent oxidoreductase (nitroreductase family)
MSDWNAGIIEEFRANDGVVGGPFDGDPVLLLHHVGAKTGTRRVNPLLYQDLGGSYAIFASKGGAPTNPAWFHNLMTHPETSVEVGTEHLDVRARIAEGEERDRIWTRQKATDRRFDEYDRKTDREIPVIILEPR